MMRSTGEAYVRLFIATCKFFLSANGNQLSKKVLVIFGPPINDGLRLIIQNQPDTRTNVAPLNKRWWRLDAPVNYCVNI